MTGETGLTLSDVLGDAAEGLEGVSREDAPGSEASWSVGGAVFASISRDRTEFRLDPAVAQAARRTPDTAESPRGPEWVSFRPALLDDHAVDRAEAWFGSAYRRAVKAARPR